MSTVDALKKEAAQEINSFLPLFDLEAYVARFTIGRRGQYGWLAPEVIEREGKLRRESEHIRLLTNKYLAIRLLENFDPRDATLHLPSSMATLYDEDQRRIARQLVRFELEFYRFTNDAFLKDLAILTHQLVPVGSEYVHADAGVPRSLLFKKGVGQFFTGCVTCLGKTRGFYPFLALHAHVLNLQHFSPAGWQRTYALVAELLELNPRFKGVIGSSWFLDPEIARISPHLAYLRCFPEEHGAAFLFAGYDKDGESGALAKSKTRRALYEAGQYTPAVYMRIWSRQSLISWKNRAVGALSS